jgi:manganese-dependent inorganic pyrophosphatase
MPHVYVTGHKNPDTDTIASAIGYAEFKNLVDAENEYARPGWARSTPRRPGPWRRAGPRSRGFWST